MNYFIDLYSSYAAARIDSLYIYKYNLMIRNNITFSYYNRKILCVV